MAEVNTIDGASDGAGMSKWKFSGSPEDMFEHHPQVGEIRVLTVTVECTSTGTEQLASGTRDFAKWAVREAGVGTVGTLKGKKGPEQIPGQMSIDDDEDAEPNPEYGDYRPTDPDGDWAPPADQVTAAHEGEGRAPENVHELFSDTGSE